VNKNVLSVDSTLSPRQRKLLEEMGQHLEAGLVPLQIYNDRELYELEQERIFGRSWVFLAHESEIPNSGDYVLRSIGEDPWIVIRDDAGKVHVLFNSCRHRGTQVCPADRGNTSLFRCPYHGWTYDNSGALVVVPERVEAYKRLDLREWGLHEAPQVATYHGLIFACLDAGAPSLADYLGGFRWYMDLSFGMARGGMEVVGEPNRWVMEGDWKSGAENFSGDPYHTASLHRSTFFLRAESNGRASAQQQVGLRANVANCDGHGASLILVSPDQPGFFSYPPEVVSLFDREKVSPAQWDVASRMRFTFATVFPNFSWVHSGGSWPEGEPGAQRLSYLSFRQWQPRGPGKIEVWSWVMVPKEASQEYKERSYRVAMAHFGPSGNMEQDDTVVWGSIARAAGGTYARTANLKLNLQMGLEGMSEAEVLADWPGPGLVYDRGLEEGSQRTILRHWLAELTRA
jgi:phenylpropionate dioxygenase-like ring-hydroxylating dioxygenase large terminal subunit